VVLASGNAAKLYCLNWIEQRVREAAGNPLTVLDLGCGRASAFVMLMDRYPQVRYVGIEPSPAVCEVARRNMAGRNATIITGWGYHVYGRLVREQFDVVVSFSVMEHVYRRQLYLDSVRDCLKDTGHVLINYDAGHFLIPASLKERVKNTLGPLLAPLGFERYYQRFVREAEFRQMAKNAGLQIVEAKFFNTYLKGVHKNIPPEFAEQHMERWLEYELWLNDLGIAYDDSKARTWFTRNFILRKEGPTDRPG
jgi:SAM-dependent methyltransferase